MSLDHLQFLGALILYYLLWWSKLSMLKTIQTLWSARVDVEVIQRIQYVLCEYWKAYTPSIELATVVVMLLMVCVWVVGILAYVKIELPHGYWINVNLVEKGLFLWDGDLLLGWLVWLLSGTAVFHWTVALWFRAHIQRRVKVQVRLVIHIDGGLAGLPLPSTAYFLILKAAC